MKVLIIDSDIDNGIDLSPFEGSTEERLKQHLELSKPDNIKSTTYTFLNNTVYPIDIHSPILTERFDLIFNLGSGNSGDSTKAWTPNGLGPFLLVRIAPEILSIYHPIGREATPLPATGYINWVDKDTLKYITQFITVLNLDKDDMDLSTVCIDLLIEKIIRKSQCDMETIHSHHSLKDLSKAITHLPWESTHVGVDYRFHDCVFNNEKLKTTVRFVPEPGILIDIQETRSVHDTAHYKYTFIFIDPYQTKFTHGGKAYTAKLTAMSGKDITTYLSHITNMLDRIKSSS